MALTPDQLACLLGASPFLTLAAAWIVGLAFLERYRVPGAGGVSGWPAKHWTMLIQCLAASPRTDSDVSATLRVCVTTWQKATASPSTESLSEAFHSQVSPNGVSRRTDGMTAGTGSPRLR